MRFLCAIACLVMPAIAAASSGAIDVIVEVELPEAMSQIQSTGPAPAVLYVNRCPAGTCTILPGSDSSRANSSSLVKGQAILSAYNWQPGQWDEVMDCVREMYAPFGIAVTDIEPGQVPHFETVVAGRPTDLGYPSRVGGVAPFNCEVIPEAMSFVFPSALPSTQSICETIAHEAAHPWGLEHTYECDDTMSYLGGCGGKAFVDDELSCGEDSPEACRCGSKQNSYRRLLSRFGPSNPTPPLVDLLEPAADARVDPGFRVRVQAFDDTRVAAVELLIDGMAVATTSTQPYEFVTPAMAPGPHLIEVRAYDDMYSTSTAMAQVVVGEACSADDDCPGGKICAGDVCVSGPGVSGGLGNACEYNDDCESGLCRDAALNDYRCVMSCDSDSACPAGFSCDTFGAGDPMCVPAEPTGCQMSGQPPAAMWMLAFAFFLLPLRRRAR